ncbi:MAG: transposase zinc-binding domain-containing protein, partial [Rubrivivax sp.]|nr:transposase zinc-binding domain-containing protein [Rubrivivax sp.]
QHAAAFFAQAEDAAGAEQPQFVKDEFDAFLECGILAHGFLRLRCGDCGYKLLAFSCKRCGLRHSASGACRRTRRTWWTTPSPIFRGGSGRCHCRYHCVRCWPRSPKD